MDGFWIVLTGTLVASVSGVLGAFLLLRKMSMMGDAISHAVLPGIVIAYLIVGHRASFSLILGAILIGLLTTFMIENLSIKGKLQVDASIGISFTFLFSLGIILISKYANQIDIDTDCVLHGEIAFVPLDTIYWNNMNLGPRPIWILGGTAVLVASFIAIGFKGLYITTFNLDYAKSLGINVIFWHYALMALVSITTVVSFESVGAILVVAFLVIPPSTAYLFTDNFKYMLALTVVFGFLSALFGYSVSVWLNSSIAGSMSVVAGGFLVLGVLFSPKRGLVVRWMRSKRISPHQPAYRK
ncbi:MAG: metal ABC transporter permease [Schleiferiaceae bacterium]|nr:metal ABC transporter permease [Schleiferiaceae bacterium]